VKEIRAVGLPILSGKVDIANVRVEFESGCVANFTASRVSTERVRKLRFFQAGQYISIDYGRQDVLVLSVGSAHGAHSFAKNANEWGTQHPQIQMEKPATTAEEPLLAEIKAFLQSVRDRSRPVVSLEDGRRALELGLAILAEIARHAGRIGVTAEVRGQIAEVKPQESDL
jgi:predicted dehydrogenase